MPSNTCSSSFPISSSPGSASGLSAGNIVVASFVSAYCTLGNSSLSHPSLFGIKCELCDGQFLKCLFRGTSSRHQPVRLSCVFYSQLGSFGRFFATQTFCRQPRIFSHPGEAGYKNKGRAIHRSGGPTCTTRKRQGPGFRAPNVLGWETALVYQEEGMRDYRYCNMGGSLYCLYVDLLLYSVTLI